MRLAIPINPTDHAQLSPPSEQEDLKPIDDCNPKFYRPNSEETVQTLKFDQSQFLPKRRPMVSTYVEKLSFKKLIADRPGTLFE